MASDGCQPVAWKQSFPFLPTWLQPKPASSYYNEKDSIVQEEAGREDAATGTWNGPAPTGYGNAPRHAQDQSPTATMSKREPDTLLLPGGGRLPLIGLGTFKVSSPEVISKAVQLGYRHFDCATVYGNQATVGQGLKTFLGVQGNRSQLFITSKVWNEDWKPETADASVRKSIADLGCDYLDLLLVHWPVPFVPGTSSRDPQASLPDLWGAMEGLVEQGLVKYLGVSNFDLPLIEDMLQWAQIKPIVNEIELHPLLPQRKLVGVCVRKGMYSIAYCPLGGQGLFGGLGELLSHPEVAKIAKETGKSPAQVLLRWNIQRGVAVIPKASSEEHLRDNIEGIFEWTLTWDQKSALDKLECGRRYIDPPFHTFTDPEKGGALKPSSVL